MPIEDIDIGLSDEERAIRDETRKFAEEVVRPAGVELDPFGAELTGEPERRKGVLLGSFTGATMGDHGGGRCHSHSLPPLRTTCGHKYEFLYFTFEKQAGRPSCPLKKKNRFQLFLAQR